MKRTIEWGSPKHYQKGWEKDSNSSPAKLPKPKSKYCKKLKGQHQYREWIPYSIWPPIISDELTGFWERFCIGCNRKDTWRAPDVLVKGEYWKPDLTARPPGFSNTN